MGSHDHTEARLHGSPLRVPAGGSPGPDGRPGGGREGLALRVAGERAEGSLLWL